MKNNNLKAKTSVNQTNNHKILKELKIVSRIKNRLRQSVSLLLISALLFGALAFDLEIFKAWAQSGCGGPDRIFQGCALGGGQVEKDLTDQAVDDVISMYKLSIADRTLVLRSLRSEVRAMMYVRMLALIKKPNKTAAEIQALAIFAGKIKETRVRAAVAARTEYDLWQQNPCGGYQPPAPYTYRSPGCTFYTIILNGAPYAPSFEEFQQYGAARANGAMFTDDTKIAAEKTSLAVGTAAGLGFAAAGTGIGVLVGQSLTFSSLSAVLPFAAGTWGAWAPNVGQGGAAAVSWVGRVQFIKLPVSGSVSSGSVGGTALGGPVAVITTAIQILVTQTINVVNQAQLPDKLNQAIVDMQNANISLGEMVATDAGNSEIYLNFISQTLPEFAADIAPDPQPTDRAFVVYDPAASQTSETQVLNARLQWNDNRYLQLRLTGGLFAHPDQTGAPSGNNPSRQSIAIRYLDWDNKPKTAYRTGSQFFVVNPANALETKLSDEIRLKADNRNVVVKIKQTDLQAQEIGTNPISCGTTSNPGQGTDKMIGKVAGAGEPASSLSVTINGAATATAGGVTIRNLRINDNYEVIANVLSDTAPTPTIANFTGAVTNSIGQQKTFPVEIKKTAVVNNLPSSTIGRMTLGDYFEAEVGSTLEISCSSHQFTVSGDLPPGLKVGRPEGSVTPQIFLYGTPTSAGKYDFTFTKQYANGESISQNYVIVVNTDLMRMDDSATSWWRAESGAADHFNRANGEVVGNIVFEKGRVNRGFNFNGSDSYIRLPENSFSPGNNFTFETWFKTDRAGVILGSQPVADPYGSTNGATPLVYVTNDGKLQVQMFRDQYNRSIKTQRSVNDNQYHHVAVTYSASDQMRRVYLDGEEVGSLFGGQLASSTKYQFGTGYAMDAANGGTNGWLNFTGVIDEPTVYSRALGLDDIKKIYAVGGFGKLYLKVRPYAPQVRDGNDGGLLMDAQSGLPLTFKLRWQTPGIPFPLTAEQDTSNFLDLRSANYQIIVEDEFENKYETSALVPNAPANIQVSTQVEQPRCAYAATGSIRVLINGGNSIPVGTAYQYSLLGGAVRQDSNLFTELPTTTYYPRVHDTQNNAVYEGQHVTLTGPSPFAFSPGAFANGQQNVAYTQTFTLSGNTAPYTFRAEGGFNNNYELPAGLTATVAPDRITFSGTPTASGTFPIRVIYTDRNGCQDSKTLNLTIAAPGNVSIGGRVTNGGQGVPNATVALSGGAQRTTTTDAAGNYAFLNLSPNQDYTATVSLAGYTFADSSRTFNAVAANVADADFATAFVHYEGDIAPRTAGDGKVDVRDYVALNRIINNQEPMPAAGGEWQRASVSPRSSLGSTRLLSTDMPQILRYIVRNDPLTLVGGPSIPAQSSLMKDASLTKGAKVQIASEPPFLDKIFVGQSQNESSDQNGATAAAATVSAATVNYTSGTVSVPVSLSSDGTVAAAQFTVSYDSSKLTLTSVSSGGDFNNQFTINTATPGKVNVVAHRLGMGNFPVNVTLLKLDFSVNAGAVGNSPIEFTDAPTERLAVNANANPITLNSSPGRVQITAPTAASVSVAGRVLTPSGSAISRAEVLIMMPNGEVRAALTNSFGYYRFDGVPVGASYALSVKHKRYLFDSRIISVMDAVENLDFVASDNP